jgi:CRISPR-associated protein Cmr3
MSWYFISPTDVLFFRDAQPFGAGDEHLATSIFPPNPRTVAGAFRSMILGNVDVDWKAYKNGEVEANDIRNQIGTPSGILDSEFSMKGPFLAYRKSSFIEIHTKLPSDAYIEDIDKHQFRAFAPIQTSLFTTSWPQRELHPLWPPGSQRKDQPKENYWMGLASINSYAQGNEFSAKLESSIVEYEPRVGNAKDAQTGAALEQFLYQATFIQMRPSYGFVVWLSDDLKDLPDMGYLILGGESKAAKYEKIGNDIAFDFKLDHPTNQFKVIIMTPAYFSGGWQPESGDWSNVLGFQAKLIAASLGKPLFLGGYDVANHQERAIHSLVPPGSVYYFKTQETVDELKDPFTESISPEMPLNRLGYGQAFLGQWNWQTMKEEK